jgi:hypothetical protein
MVMVLSEFGHMMTMGEPGMLDPKPIAIQPRDCDPVLCKTYSTVEPLTVAEIHIRVTHIESPVRASARPYILLCSS